MAEGGYDGSVVIDTKMNLDGINLGTKSASASINKLTTDFNKQVNAIQKNEKALDSMNKELQNISKGDVELRSLVGMEASLKRATREVQVQQKAYDELIAKIQTAETGVQFTKGIGRPEDIAKAEAEYKLLDQQSIELATNLENARDRATQLENKIKQVRLNPANSQEAINLRNKMATASAEIEKSKNNANGLKNQIKEVATQKGIAKVSDDIKKMGKNSTSTISKIGKLAGKILGLGKSGNSASNGFQKLANRIKSLALLVFVFQVLRNALRNLAQSLGRTLMANEQFANSFNAIKVNLLTAFAPIWEAILPSLLSFMNVLANVTAYIAQFVAMLFGKTVAQSKASAKALYNQSKAIDKVGKSAQGASTSIDELNVISQESGDSGDGAGGLDFGAVETPDFGELTKDFYQLGLDLGNKLVEGLQSIPWDKIRAWSIGLVTGIALFLNGVIDSGLIQQVGTTFAEAVNTILLIGYTFLTTFNFGNFGTALAEGINNIITTANWQLLGETLGKFIVSIVDMAFNFITTINWEEYGTSLSELVNNFFSTIDWVKIGTTISDAIKGIFTSLLSFLTTVDWVQIGFAIGDLIGSIDWIAVAELLIAGVVIIFGVLLIAIGALIFKLGEHIYTWLKEGISDPIR